MKDLILLELAFGCFLVFLFKKVPDCIAKLSQAGVKIWVLTGDKTETAINIGYLQIFFYSLFFFFLFCKSSNVIVVMLLADMLVVS